MPPPPPQLLDMLARLIYIYEANISLRLYLGAQKYQKKILGSVPPESPRHVGNIRNIAPPPPPHFSRPSYTTDFVNSGTWLEGGGGSPPHPLCPLLPTPMSNIQQIHGYGNMKQLVGIEMPYLNFFVFSCKRMCRQQCYNNLQNNVFAHSTVTNDDDNDHVSRSKGWANWTKLTPINTLARMFPQ